VFGVGSAGDVGILDTFLLDFCGYFSDCLHNLHSQWPTPGGATKITIAMLIEFLPSTTDQYLPYCSELRFGAPSDNTESTGF